MHHPNPTRRHNAPPQAPEPVSPTDYITLYWVIQTHTRVPFTAATAAAARLEQQQSMENKNKNAKNNQQHWHQNFYTLKLKRSNGVVENLFFSKTSYFLLFLFCFSDK